MGKCSVAQRSERHQRRTQEEGEISTYIGYKCGVEMWNDFDTIWSVRQ